MGQPISKYVPEKSEKGTIIGVMKDFKKYSLTNNVFPLRMILHEMPQDNYTTLTLQFDEQDRTTVINHLRGLWEKKYPGTPFNYEDPYQVLISNNQEVTDFSRILLMYASISLVPHTVRIVRHHPLCYPATYTRNRNSEDSRCIIRANIMACQPPVPVLHRYSLYTHCTPGLLSDELLAATICLPYTHWYPSFPASFVLHCLHHPAHSMPEQLSGSKK